MAWGRGVVVTHRGSLHARPVRCDAAVRLRTFIPAADEYEDILVR
jgi:hypothetical protein